MRSLFIISCLLLSFAVTAKPTDINLVAIDDDPPFVYVENTESKGLYIEILNAVAAHLPEYNITVKHMPWRTIQNQDFETPVDGFLGAYFRITEWEDVYPYSYPIYHEQMCIICAKTGKEPDSIKYRQRQWPQDYSDTRLGSVRGFTGWFNYNEEARLLGTLNVFEFPYPELALKGVNKGVVDCSLFEKTIFIDMTKHLVANNELPQDHTVHIASELSRDSVHIAYYQKGMSDHRLAFAKAFDTTFAKLLHSNELTEIYNAYGVRH